MTFFGYTIGDWAEVISIIGVGVSAGSWLFKKIALDPLRSDIQMLSDTINRQLELHEQSLADLNAHLKTHDDELGSHSVRITRLEDHVGIKKEKITMKINWKVRVLSVKFWLALVPAALLVVQTAAAVFGYNWDFANLGKELTRSDQCSICTVDHCGGSRRLTQPQRA